MGFNYEAHSAPAYQISRVRQCAAELLITQHINQAHFQRELVWGRSRSHLFSEFSGPNSTT